MEIRVSVANLVPRIVHTGTGEAFFVGILNRTRLYRDHRRVFGAIGGAAELTVTGARLLEARFAARFENGRDARFFIDHTHLGEVMGLFEERQPSFCEIDPQREICEELVMGEFHDMPSVLGAMSPFTLRFVKSLAQKTDLTAPRASEEGPPSFRLFFMFEMMAPASTLAQFHEHPAVRFFTEEEIGSTQQGLVQGRAHDGSVIGSNLFW